MKARNIVGILVAAPALVLAVAAPSNAATTGAIDFAGTVKLVPQSTPSSAQFCLFGAPTGTCGNGQPSTGIAAGAGVTGLPPAVPQQVVVDGLQGSAAYNEDCVPGNDMSVPRIGNAKITANVHDLGSSAWSAPINTEWLRAGLVAVISGDATGAALFAPVGPAVCGTPATFAVVGSAEIRY